MNNNFAPSNAIRTKKLEKLIFEGVNFGAKLEAKIEKKNVKRRFVYKHFFDFLRTKHSSSNSGVIVVVVVVFFCPPFNIPAGWITARNLGSQAEPPFPRSLGAECRVVPRRYSHGRSLSRPHSRPLDSW